MKRAVLALDALALLWAVAASVYLLLASSRSGITTSAILISDAGAARPLPPSLASAEGVWMAALLLCVTVLAAIPLGVAAGHPSGHRMTAWTVALVLLGFCALSGGLFVGLLYLPSTLLLIAAAAAGGEVLLSPSRAPRDAG